MHVPDAAEAGEKLLMHVPDGAVETNHANMITSTRGANG
jgi:hypothetical protein